MKSLRYLLLLASALGVAPALAQVDDAEDRDAEMAAKMRGIPVIEAKRQAQLDRKAANLEERMSNNPNFVGLEIVRAGSTYRVKASFKRGNKPDKQSLNADQDLDAVLDTVEGLHTKTEQRQAVATIMSTLRPAGIKFNAYPDQSTGVVIVETDQVAKATDLLKALGDRISVVQGTAFPAPTVDLRGGQTVTFGDGGGGTSAFPVKTSTERGILTVGHGFIPYNGTWSSAQPGGLSTQAVTLTVRGALNDATRDLGWGANTSTANKVTNTIFDGQGNRAITSGATTLPSKGTTICKYGRNTPYICMTVENNSWTSTYGTAPLGPLVLMGGTAATVQRCGDSGGPLFYGNVAHGVASGVLDSGVDPNCPQGSKMYYTPISRISGLGVTLVTAP